MFTSQKCYFVVVLSFFIVAHVEGQQGQSCCDCPALEQFLKNIASKDIANLLIAREREKIREALINASQRNYNSGKSVNQDNKNSAEREDHFFQLKLPIELSKEELKKSARERIKEKFIGKLPDRVNQFISYSTDPEYYVKNNIKLPNRLLLSGSPGVGKTHLFKVLAQELQLPSLSFSASDFAEKYIGEASKKIRKVFEIAQELNKPVLIFIDEIDALAMMRSDRMHEENRKTLITLLREIQDLQDNKNVFILCATNDPDSLDPAFKSRFPGKSYDVISSPGKDERTALFMKFFKENNIEQNLEFAQRLAEVTAEDKGIFFSVRELEDIVITARFAKAQDCNDNKICNKSLCHYLRKSIDDTGKKGHYASFFGTMYCDGI